MIRWFNFINYPEDAPWQEAERWYLGAHTQEAKHQIGLKRYISYHPLNWPDGFPSPTPSWKQPNWVAELWYDDVDTWYHGAIEKEPDYTPPPGGMEFYRNFVSILTNEEPDWEWFPKWLGKEPDYDPEAKMIRALWLLDVPVAGGASAEEAEKWYLETHTREVAELQSQSGLARYITYRGLEHPDHPQTKRFRWLTELWYWNVDVFVQAMVEHGAKFTPPPGGYGALANWQMTLTSRVPEYDYFKEMPQIP